MASQCKSRDCRNVCVGYEAGEGCHSHEDCVENTYCNHDLVNWPYKSTCQLYREVGEECDEDFQCGIDHFCWYGSKEDRASEKRTCLELYSQEKGTSFGWFGGNKLKDYTQNGRYCLSGLAYQVGPGATGEARCSETD